MWSDVALIPKTTLSQRHIDPDGNSRAVNAMNCVTIEPPLSSINYTYNIGLLVDAELTVHKITNITKNAVVSVEIDHPHYVQVEPATKFSLAPGQSISVALLFSPEKAQHQVFSGVREWLDNVSVAVSVEVTKNEPIYI